MEFGLRKSYINNSYLSCLENKNITVLKPIFLVYWKDPDKNGYKTTFKSGEIMYCINDNHRDNDRLCNCTMCKAEFIIKINTQIVFCIEDIFGYQRIYEESGITYYEIIPEFLYESNKIKISDTEMIKVSDDYMEKINSIEYFNINNVFFRDVFFNRYNIAKLSMNESMNDLFNKSKYISTITNREKLEFISENYKNDYLIEDL